MSVGTYSSDGPTCPACGRVFTPDEAHYFDETGYTEDECDQCGCKFSVAVHHSVSWECMPIEQMRPVMWQPIATAPKDGTIIRAYIPGYPELEGIEVRWVELSQEWEPYPQRLTFGPAQDVPDPTMWMPRYTAADPG